MAMIDKTEEIFFPACIGVVRDDSWVDAEVEPFVHEFGGRWRVLKDDPSGGELEGIMEAGFVTIHVVEAISAGELGLEGGGASGENAAAFGARPEERSDRGREVVSGLWASSL